MPYYYTILYYNILYYTILYYTILFHVESALRDRHPETCIMCSGEQ